VVLRPELGRRPTYFQRAKFESKGRDANCIANSLITDFPHATVFDMVGARAFLWRGFHQAVGAPW
jgi:hypothetical protein